MPAPRPRPLVAALALGALLGAAPRSAQASPEDIFGFGARAAALGQTGAADAEGYEAVYGNPALLSRARERQLTLGYAGAAFDLRAGSRLSYDALHGSIIGATLPLPFGGVLKDRIAIGLGFFTPFERVVRGRILYPETPQFLLADRSQSVAVQAGIGVDLGYGFRLGGGFAALAALSGSVLVATDATGRIGTVVEDTLVASYGPIVGASWERGNNRVGATFRGELVGRFNVVITVRDLGDIVVPPLNISGVAQYDPHQLALEYARTQGPYRLAAGATYKRWSAYPGPAEATVRCPLQDANGQPILERCSALVPESPGYSDTLSIRLGAERAFTPTPSLSLFARGGLLFDPSPAPAQTKASNLYDSHRLALTLGYGVEIGRGVPRVSLDFFQQTHWLLPRKHVKEAGVAASNLGAPSVQSSGVILAWGATAGVKF
jgi:long-chain fatty acid transport protein